MSPNRSAPGDGPAHGCEDRGAGLDATRARRLRAQIAARAYAVDGERVAVALLRRSAVLPAIERGPRRPGCQGRLDGKGTLTADVALADRLAVARAELHMDVAVLGEIAGEQEVARRVVGDWPGVESTAALEAAAVDRVDSFWHHLLTGRLPSAVGDVRRDPRTRDLPAVGASDVGALTPSVSGGPGRDLRELGPVGGG